MDIHGLQMLPIARVCISAPGFFSSPDNSRPLCPWEQRSADDSLVLVYKPQLRQPLSSMILGHELCNFSQGDYITVALKVPDTIIHPLLTAFPFLNYFPPVNTLLALESLSQGVLLGKPD